jgi:hypothetical protein
VVDGSDIVRSNITAAARF